MAKGFTQNEYHETFALIAEINSIRVLDSLAVNYNWPFYQPDVKNVLLKGDLEKEVFMDLPPGFAKGLGVIKVCKLKKFLSSFKQTSRA